MPVARRSCLLANVKDDNIRDLKCQRQRPSVPGRLDHEAERAQLEDGLLGILEEQLKDEFGRGYVAAFPNRPSNANAATRNGAQWDAGYRERLDRSSRSYSKFTFTHDLPPTLIADWTADDGDPKDCPDITLVDSIDVTEDAQRVLDARLEKEIDEISGGRPGLLPITCQSGCECEISGDSNHSCCFRNFKEHVRHNRGDGGGRIVPIRDEDVKAFAALADDMKANGPKALTKKEMEITDVQYCTNLCGCDEDLCTQREERYRRRVPIVVFRHPLKGWTIRTLASMVHGQAFMIFTGEIITATEMRRIQDEDSIVDGISAKNWVFELCPVDGYERRADLRRSAKTESDLAKEKLALDFRFYGNEARYVAHSCAPNTKVLSAYPHRYGKSFPHLLMVARHDIRAGEEITFDYGFQDDEWFFPSCACGYSKCRHPADDVAPDDPAPLHKRRSAAGIARQQIASQQSTRPYKKARTTM